MRDIEFRGKRRKDGEWIYGYLTAVDEISNINEVATPREEVDEDTVGEWTGYYDKEGKKIFEGDIIEKYDPYNVMTNNYTGFVCMVKGCWCVRHWEYGGWCDSRLCFDDFATSHKQKVIGNIEDNPSLYNEIIEPYRKKQIKEFLSEKEKTKKPLSSGGGSSQP